MTDMTPLCYVDTETTGLDPFLHQVFEVAFMREDETEPTTVWLPHQTISADPDALNINRYRQRVPDRFQREAGSFRRNEGFGGQPDALRTVSAALHGVTLVVANPSFDTMRLHIALGSQPWHQRPIDVETQAMVVFDWERPPGLRTIADELRARGFDIPSPDHSAAGDVLTLAAAYRALRTIRTEQVTGAVL